MKWIGVDYGSKLAGTTVACYRLDGRLYLQQSEKKKDADAFLAKLFKELKPEYVYLDAPLSLPAAFFGRGDDYFYRQCDKATHAMSPMFLGGLTARAMKFAAQCPEIDFRETYPAYLIKTVLDHGGLYTKKSVYNSKLADHLAKVYKLKFDIAPRNWHQLDALACWLSGWRTQSGEGVLIGDKEEGVIWV